MAIYHLSMKTIARSSGRSSTAAAAYRAGCKIADARTGEVHDYRRRRGVEMTALYMPGGQQVDRAALWSAVEQHHKRGDAVVAREIEVALPAELSREQRQRLAQGYGHELAQRYGVAVDVCVHAPDRRSDERNYHAHILLSGCSVATDGTLGKKAVELDPIHCARHKIESAADRERVRWADLCNAALERDGHAARIDHRSHAKRGIDRIPTMHLGPDAKGFERRTGQPSDKRIREQQRVRDQREAAARTISAAEVSIGGLEQQITGLQQEQAAEAAAAAEIRGLLAEGLRQWQEHVQAAAAERERQQAWERERQRVQQQEQARAAAATAAAEVRERAQALARQQEQARAQAQAHRALIESARGKRAHEMTDAERSAVAAEHQRDAQRIADTPAARQQRRQGPEMGR